MANGIELTELLRRYLGQYRRAGRAVLLFGTPPAGNPPSTSLSTRSAPPPIGAAIDMPDMDITRLHDVLADPVAQRLYYAGELTHLAYTARDGSPRVIPIGYVWNGTHVIVCTSTNRKRTSEDEFRNWEPEVRRLYKQMARIEITPTWAKILDVEVRIPSAVEELARQQAVQRR